jgi:hypothetical protein
LIDAGVDIALASGADTGTSHTSSMNLVVAFGVLRCRLIPAEAVHAATTGGARALRAPTSACSRSASEWTCTCRTPPATPTSLPRLPARDAADTLVYEHGTRVT